MAGRWYVLSCLPRKERVIYHQLHDRGFEVYYPYLIIKTPNPNILKIEPFFPGYLFVNVDLEHVAPSTFQWMPLTEGLVCLAENPAFVPNHIIQAINRNVWKINSDVLGVPGNVLDIQRQNLDVEDTSGNGDIFDQKLSADDRSRSLFQYLQIESLVSD